MEAIQNVLKTAARPNTMFSQPIDDIIDRLIQLITYVSTTDDDYDAGSKTTSQMYSALRCMTPSMIEVDTLFRIAQRSYRNNIISSVLECSHDKIKEIDSSDRSSLPVLKTVVNLLECVSNWINVTTKELTYTLGMVSYVERPTWRDQRPSPVTIPGLIPKSAEIGSAESKPAPSTLEVIDGHAVLIISDGTEIDVWPDARVVVFVPDSDPRVNLNTGGAIHASAIKKAHGLKIVTRHYEQIKITASKVVFIIGENNKISTGTNVTYCSIGEISLD
jgi:hypothetical protein